MILQAPNDILSTPCDFVTRDEAQKIEKKLREEYDALPENIRVGLAAPQIGISKNVAIVFSRGIMNMSFKGAKQYETRYEGCFSIDHANSGFNKTRPKYGWATWTDIETGDKHTDEKIHGVLACVFQHELDHINGRLCNEAVV